MSAKDYHICPALFHAYIAKVSKRMQNLMTNDRREITEGEILSLIDWYLDNKIEEGKILYFESHAREGMTVQMKFVKTETNS
jgi:hypothetical protein